MHLLKTTVLLFALMVTSYVGFTQDNALEDDLRQEVFELVNKHRATKLLPALKYSEDIAIEASKHSINMASGNVDFGHDGFEGRIDRLTKKIKNVRGAAENVAYGSSIAKQIVDMWLHSPGHRKNIEGTFTTSGLGIATAKDGTLYYTQIFIKE